MATRAPLLIRAVKKPLTALSGGLAKTEKVVQVRPRVLPHCIALPIVPES